MLASFADYFLLSYQTRKNPFIVEEGHKSTAELYSGSAPRGKRMVVFQVCREVAALHPIMEPDRAHLDATAGSEPICGGSSTTRSTSRVALAPQGRNQSSSDETYTRFEKAEIRVSCRDCAAAWRAGGWPDTFYREGVSWATLPYERSFSLCGQVPVRFERP